MMLPSLPPGRVSAMKAYRVFQGEGLNVHDLRGQAGEFHGGDANFDIVAAGGGQQDLDLVGFLFRGFQNLEVQSYFFQRIWNILVRLKLDLGFHLIFAEVRRHRDDFGNDRRA